VVGSREGILQRLVGLYKFERTKSAYKDLGGLLLDTLLVLPPETVDPYFNYTVTHTRARLQSHATGCALFCKITQIGI